MYVMHINKLRKLKLIVNAWLSLLALTCHALNIASSAQASTNIPTTATFVYVTDFSSGRVLMEKQKDAPMKPAHGKNHDSLHCL